ncbi:conserved hypothetical protein [Sporisorium reilianum SRZ2]|uniref:Phosphoglycerate mutase n=1 Tax=Sporisorium reilianum (strain SRZ2) TaxID=999809 RepID=E7A0Z3_SPORE|nr:conserved hypothetical protein [Sporisorium reilianum SRZ2]
MALNRLLVTLVRHGESQDNQQGIWAGFRDTPLTINGVNQARALGQSFANVPLTAIYCSDLKRAAMTADEILRSNRSIPPPPLVQSKSLREINFGQAEGQSYAHAEWMAGSSGDDARNFHFPDGESLEEVNARIAKAVRQFILPRIEALRKKPLSQNAAAAAAGDVVHICIVAHGIAIAELLRVFMALHDSSPASSSPWSDPKFTYQRVRLENTGWSRLEIAVPLQGEGDVQSGPDVANTASGSSTHAATPPAARPGAQPQYTDFGEVQTDLVEGPVDVKPKMLTNTAPPTSESAAPRPIYVRILCQNQTDHLRGFTSQQGASTSAANMVAHLAGGGSASAGTTSGSPAALPGQSASSAAAAAAAVGLPSSATLASIASNATGSTTHPSSTIAPSTPATGAASSGNGTSKSFITTPAFSRSLSSYDSRMMARELERAGAASMLAGSEAGPSSSSSSSATGYYPSSASSSALAADRHGSNSVSGGAGAGGAMDRPGYSSSPGVGSTLGAPHTPNTQFTGSGTPGNLAGATSPNPAGLTFPIGPGTSSDTWQMICIRVLPLFNGEALRTSIEELNEMVGLHVRKTLDRGQSHAIESLTLNLMSLTSTGTLTLNSKLQGLEDTRLLLRLVEVWTFFLGQVLPYCEACFLPFHTDPTLRSLVAASSSYGVSGSSNVGSFSTSTHFTQSGAAAMLSGAANVNQDLQRIDVRKILLVVFRDQVLMPIYERLLYLFAHLTELDPAFSAAEVTSNGAGAAGGGDDGIKQVSLRLLQMTSVLASILSQDGAQDAMDTLLRALRLGSKGASNGRNRSAGEGQGARAVSPTQKNNRHGWMAQKARKHGNGSDSQGEISAFGAGSHIGAGSFGTVPQRTLLTRPSHLSSFKDPLASRFGADMTEDEYLSSLRSPAGSPAISTPGQPDAPPTPAMDSTASSFAQAMQTRSGHDASAMTPMAGPRTSLAVASDGDEAEPAILPTALAA